MDRDDGFWRSPELRAEIARGKLPVGHDPNKASYHRMLGSYKAKEGPFALERFGPPANGRGTDADFMVRMAMVKRAVADGDVLVERLLEGDGHDPADLDRAMAHWRAERLGVPARQTRTPASTVTITAYQA